jgi:hypothetical protein
VTPILAQYGYPECDVRRHSPAWIAATQEAIYTHRGELLRLVTAAMIQSVCVGTVGAYSDDGQAQMRDIVDDLLAPRASTTETESGTDEPLPYDMDPNAKPDEAALAVLSGGRFPGMPPELASSNVGWRRIRKEDWERGIR